MGIQGLTLYHLKSHLQVNSKLENAILELMWTEIDLPSWSYIILPIPVKT